MIGVLTGLAAGAGAAGAGAAGAGAAAAGAGTAAAGAGALGAVGAGIKGLAGLGSLATSIQSLIGGDDDDDKAAQANWKQRIGMLNQFGSKNIYMPWAQGMWAPYGVHGWEGQRSYNFQPSSTLKNVYSNYLNRQYGMPNSIASAMVSKAMRQVAPTEKGIPQTPAAAGARGQVSPGAIAQSVLQTQMPEVYEQADYLRGAGELAKLNLQKVQAFAKILEG